ncbi:MAG: ArsR/SmtB family transcription factor [Acidimicrobiales bacterium]
MRSVAQSRQPSSRLDTLARLGRALADPTRCRLLLVLLSGPAYPSELADLLGLTRANTSNHLGCLRSCGLVVAEPVGRQVCYQLADDTIARVLTDLASLDLDACHLPDHVGAEWVR